MWFLPMYTNTLHAEPGGAEWAQLALLCRPTNHSNSAGCPGARCTLPLPSVNKAQTHNIHTPSRPRRHSGKGNRRVHPPYEVRLCPVAMPRRVAVQHGYAWTVHSRSCLHNHQYDQASFGSSSYQLLWHQASFKHTAAHLQDFTARDSDTSTTAQQSASRVPTEPGGSSGCHQTIQGNRSNIVPC